MGKDRERCHSAGVRGRRLFFQTGTKRDVAPQDALRFVQKSNGAELVRDEMIKAGRSGVIVSVPFRSDDLFIRII